MTRTSRVGGSAATVVAHYLDLLASRRIAPTQLTAAVDESSLLAVAYQNRVLPRPAFLAEDVRADLVADLRLVHACLAAIPDRLFDGSHAAAARAVGLNATQVRLVAQAAATHPGPPYAALARADLYLSTDGFRLLELNTGSSLGGFENAEINRAMLRHPALRDLVRTKRLGFVDTLRAITDTMLATCADQVHSARPVIALVDWPDSYPSYEPRLQVMASLLAGMGIDALPGHVGQLSRRAGRVHLRGEPVDIVYRAFLLDDIVTEQDAAVVAPLMEAVGRGEVAMFTGLKDDLYGSKGALALLSDDRYRDQLSPTELSRIDRILPWTRRIRRSGTGLDGSTIDVIQYAMSHRTELVLKPTLQHGGTGVVPGWSVDRQQWAHLLEAAVDGPFVLQQRVRPVPESFPGAGGSVVDEYLTWGVFLVDAAATGGDGYGGCFLRGTGDPAAGVVSLSAGASVACCFHTSELSLIDRSEGLRMQPPGDLGDGFGVERAGSQFVVREGEEATVRDRGQVLRQR